MKVVIAGAGTVGFETARQLIEEKRDVVLIEHSLVRAKHASSHLDCMVITDEATNPDALRKAGGEDISHFIAVTDSDEVNLVTCGMARGIFPASRTIARVRNLHYAKATYHGEPFLGVDYVVTPEVEAARQILDTILHGAVSDVLRFEGTDIQLWNTPVERRSPFRNRKLAQLRKEVPEPFLVAGIVRNEETIIPSGNTVIREGDRLYLAGTEATLQRLFTHAGRKQRRIERILLVGAGKVGAYVVKFLAPHPFHVTIVESNAEKCKAISTTYPDTLVLCGDISDESLLQDERLDRYDLVVAATGDQELNILSAVYARSLGVKRTMALVDNANYLRVASQLEIDSTISPKAGSVDAILKYLRKGTVKTMYGIFDGTAEVIEYVIGPESPVSGKAIMHAGLPADTLVVAIVRDGTDIMPHGAFTLKAGDTVIVIAKRSSISRMETLFGGAA